MRRIPLLLLLLSLLGVASVVAAFPFKTIRTARKEARVFYYERVSSRPQAPGADHPTLALQGFSMQFRLGAHKLKGIGTWPKGPFLNTMLAGRKKARFQMSATYLPMPTTGSSPRRVAKKRDCRGRCTLPLAKPPKPDHVFVLSGFNFGGADKKRKIMAVKQLKVRPNERKRVVEVAFHDGGNKPVDVEITYFYAPRRAFTKVSSSRAKFRSHMRHQLAGKADYPNTVLRGFDYQFLDGSRKLGGIRLSPRDTDFTVGLIGSGKRGDVEVQVDWAVIDRNWFDRASK